MTLLLNCLPILSHEVFLKEIAKKKLKTKMQNNNRKANAPGKIQIKKITT